MTKWYVKDLSKLTGVSVQTLHHYDRIDLLKPSVRQDNGYRLYSEKDLLKLQQIISLKFFGFELAQIKYLLISEVNTLENLKNQVRFLEKKAKTLLESSKTLNEVISSVTDNKSIPWETIIELIEVYRMTQQIENTWVKEVFNLNELKQYAEFESELKNRFTLENKQEFDKEYKTIIDTIKKNIDKNPESDFGIEISNQTKKLIWGLYGKKHANLRNSLWNKGFKQGKNKNAHGMTPELVSWLDKAHKYNFGIKISNILEMSEIDSKQAQNLFSNILEEMCGDYEDMKQELIKEIIEDDRTSDNSKSWLSKFFKK